MLCGGTGNELDVVCNLSTRETEVEGCPEPQNETVSKSQSCEEEGRSQCRLGLTGVSVTVKGMCSPDDRYPQVQPSLQMSPGLDSTHL